MHGQGLLHPFAQTPCRARIEIHQFAMQLIQRLLGSGVVFQSVSRIEPFRYRWFLLVGQMIQHVSPLVDLAALDRRRVTRVLFHGGSQGLAPVQNVEPRFGEIESATDQIAEQFANYGRVFRSVPSFVLSLLTLSSSRFLEFPVFWIS